MSESEIHGCNEIMDPSVTSSGFTELNIPLDYAVEFGKLNRYLAIVHRKWITQLVRDGVLAEFILHPSLSSSEVAAKLKLDGSFGRSWRKIIITVIPKSDKLVIPLPKQKINSQSFNEMTYSQILEYVSLTNYRNLWKEAQKKYNGRFSISSSLSDQEKYPIPLLAHDNVVRDIITRMYDCDIIKHNQSGHSNASLNRSHSNILNANVVFETNHAFYIFQEVKLRYTLQDCINYSPAIFSHNDYKLLFVLHQLLQLMRELHDRGLVLGDITLSDILVSDHTWIQVIPRICDNIYDPPKSQNSGHKDESIGNEKIAEDGDMIHDISYYCELWVKGIISNYDYISVINKLAGRKYGDPHNHYIFPWVTDFTSRNGLNWRDLTRSKFRLNKGDRQLDLTYNMAANLAPHHVSDMLSEITYYIYKARVTPMSVLCNYVRSNWVPAEYPVSIQRLQQWTPDECIPEFYTDPSVFKSIHTDLPDLEIPPWANSPQDFITAHRAALESCYVSERLHHWIDLTFGYKLTGQAAVKAKNVCLTLVDKHTNLRSFGIVQLFTCPHPQKLVPSPYTSRLPPLLSRLRADMNGEVEQFSDPEENKQTLRTPRRVRRHTSPGLVKLDKELIHLPKDYNPVTCLSVIESMHNFVTQSCNKTKMDVSWSNSEMEKEVSSVYKQVVATKRAQEILIIGCLMVELFMSDKLKAHGSNLFASCLEKRLENCRNVLLTSKESIPLSIRTVAKTILQTNDSITSEQFQSIKTSLPIGDCGLPPLSVHQLLIAKLTPLSFPTTFESLYDMLKFYHQSELEEMNNSYYYDINSSSTMISPKDLIQQKIIQFAKNLDKFVSMDCKDILYDKRWMYMLLPLVIELMRSKNTKYLAAWYLLEPIARGIGVRESNGKLLESVVYLYEHASENTNLCINDGKIGRIHLYHQDFIIRLIIRFGMETFLQRISWYIVEAVAGLRDIDSRYAIPIKTEETVVLSDEQTTRSKESSSSAAEDQNTSGVLEKGDKIPDESEVNEIAVNCNKLLERLINKSTSRLRSISLNEAETEGNDTSDKDQNNVLCSETSSESDTCNAFTVAELSRLSVIWLANRIGPILTAKYLSRKLLRTITVCYTDNYEDERATMVFDTLVTIAGIYGEAFYTLQYLPYIVDLVSSCKHNKMNNTLESGLIGCISFLKSIIASLQHSTLNEITQEVLCKSILHPTIRILSSVRILFPSGYRTRAILADKLVACLYILGMRQGHLISRSLQRFFLSFDKLRQTDETNSESLKEHKSDDHKAWSDNQVSYQQMEKEQYRNKAMEQLCAVLTPELAYESYTKLVHFFGETFMQKCLLNLDIIQQLCSLYKEEKQLSGHTYSDFGNEASKNTKESTSSQVTVSGNQIQLQNSDFEDTFDILGEVDETRHLQGNWISYFKKELKSTTTMTMDSGENKFDQIKLHTYVGHSNSVKCLLLMDNERHFISGARDNTVKLWTIENEADDNAVTESQYTYPNHRKSVLSLGYCERTSLVASCDSTVHLWNPHTGQSVAVVRSGPPINYLLPLPSPNNTILAANSHCSISILDTRRCAFVAELKVCLNSSGLIRCMAVSSSDNWVAVGQSTGVVTVLDLRNGSILSSWKAHEGEILQMVTTDVDSVLTSSLDQSLSIWNINSGKLNSVYRRPAEPIHCASMCNKHLISGSTGNRIGIYIGEGTDAVYHSTKLRSETFKGVLTAMSVLPLNKSFLLASDTGLINLFC